MLLVLCQFDCTLRSFSSIAALLRQSRSQITLLEYKTKVKSFFLALFVGRLSFPVTKYKADSNYFNVENSMHFAEDL